MNYRLPVIDTSLSAAWWTAFVLWNSLAVAMLLRRATGAFVQPLADWALLGVLVLVVTVSILFRLSFAWLGAARGRQQATASRIRPDGRVLAAVLTAAGLMILGSVSLISSALVVVVWGMWIASESVWWWRIQANSTSTPNNTRSEISRSVPPPEPLPTSIHTAPLITEPEHVEEEDAESLPEGVTQQLTRMQHGQAESLCGLVRVEFPAGHRTQFVHVAFCPPFLHLPEVNVAQVSGKTVVVKVAQVEPFGLRIEARRNESEDAQAVVLEIEATTSGEERR